MKKSLSARLSVIFTGIIIAACLILVGTCAGITFSTSHNNDVESASSKNRKAKELGIPIISEDTFIEQFGGR
jgi:uncharacterized alpha/beta hydrolase family protein